MNTSPRTKDLGTYHLKVEFEDGSGFILHWETGRRFTRGREDCHPLDAEAIPPTWEDEEGLFDCMRFAFMEGNHSCDCNKLLFMADSKQEERPDDPPCGETMPIKRLTAITPTGEEKIIYPL